MRTREISQNATPENSNDYYVEMLHSSGQILFVTVAAIDIQDVLNHLETLGTYYKNPTKIEKL